MSEHEGAQHLAALERVLSVFTPALTAVVDELTRAFKKQYVPAKHFPSPNKGHSQHFGARQGLRTSGSNTSLNSSSNVFQTPGFVSARAPMTEGYDPDASHEGGGDGTGDDVPSVGPEFLALMRFQVSFLSSLSSCVLSGVALEMCPCSLHCILTTISLTIVSSFEQHERLYPDRRIDELADCGITDLKVYAAAVRSSNCVTLLHTVRSS